MVWIPNFPKPTVQKPIHVLNIEEQGKEATPTLNSTKDRISKRSRQDSGLADSLQWTLPSWHFLLLGLKFSSAGENSSFGSNKAINMQMCLEDTLKLWQVKSLTILEYLWSWSISYCSLCICHVKTNLVPKLACPKYSPTILHLTL